MLINKHTGLTDGETDRILTATVVHCIARSRTLKILLHILATTPCRRKVTTFKLSVTLSNLNQFSKLLHCWKAYEICYKTHMTLPTSL